MEDAGEIKDQVPAGTRNGHAAWTDWPWKLHRIAGTKGRDATYELYNLAQDPMETSNLAGRQAGRVDAMAEALDAWMGSVVNSLNGRDYE